MLNILIIALQGNMSETDTDIVMLETHILLPLLGLIMIAVVIAGIVITVQKHKRY